MILYVYFLCLPPKTLPNSPKLFASSAEAKLRPSPKSRREDGVGRRHLLRFQPHQPVAVQATGGQWDKEGMRERGKSNHRYPEMLIIMLIWIYHQMLIIIKCPNIQS